MKGMGLDLHDDNEEMGNDDDEYDKILLSMGMKPEGKTKKKKGGNELDDIYDELGIAGSDEDMDDDALLAEIGVKLESPRTQALGKKK